MAQKISKKELVNLIKEEIKKIKSLNEQKSKNTDSFRDELEDIIGEFKNLEKLNNETGIQDYLISTIYNIYNESKEWRNEFKSLSKDFKKYLDELEDTDPEFDDATDLDKEIRRLTDRIEDFVDELESVYNSLSDIEDLITKTSTYFKGF
jgi:chromosome segregation ATPase